LGRPTFQVCACTVVVVACMTAGLAAQKKRPVTPPPPMPPPPVIAPARPAPPPPVPLADPEPAVPVPPIPAEAPVPTPKFLEATAELRKFVAFDALYDVDRPAFDEVAQLVVDAEARKAPAGQIMIDVWPRLMPRIKRYVRAGTDRAVVNYYRTMFGELEASIANPAVCRAVAGASDLNFSLSISPNAMAAMQVSLAELIISSKDRHTDAFMPIDTAQAHMGRVILPLIQNPRDLEIFQSRSTNDKDAARRCEIIVGMLRGILELPEDVAADLFRWFVWRQ
jgi:hypothetical protein